MYIVGLSGWKLKLASWMFGNEDGTSQQEATGKQCLFYNAALNYHNIKVPYHTKLTLVRIL